MTALPNCGDCDAKPGEKHVPGCDVERCTACGGQRIAGCQCPGHDPHEARWTGVWPGLAECIALGWYVHLVLVGPPYDQLPHARGGWVPCEPTHPGARPDMNRWVIQGVPVMLALKKLGWKAP